MFNSRNLFATLLIAACACSASAQGQKGTEFPGIGRAATPKEVAAWDIDVRPDFKGLPPGKGSVAQGQDIWEARCASCHGVFGESNTVFNPLVGGTTKDDVKTGRVATLTRTDYPGRTTLMKVPTVSTLWDYIHRAMPWDKPKSLKPDEVYAVTAFLLNLGHIVPDDFTLSNQNIAEVQDKMPNRKGMSTAHAMWPGKELGGTTKPDALGSACMNNCGPEPKIASRLPEHARNNHGNLREQQRTVGPQRGSDTTKPEGALGAAAGPVKVVGPAGGAASPNAAAIALTQKHACTACHNVEGKLVGPSFVDIGKKHAGKADYLAGKIKAGGVGVWGEIPMPPQELPDADAKAIAAWLAAGAGK
ncbi:c-type cytochrome [Ottowia testudinis]|uniref:C-type cytochrome n=1 Tax=Ottowia testudinis TaxID=2816950 RepID=A0A975CI59_9BURK|nr:c-type cytochrome [Ottowia testudinis]QTD46212.1 c-type cytochrome [Ottowia testudinis]